MTSTTPSVIKRPDEADASTLARYLLTFDWENRDEETHRYLVHEGLPLWHQIIQFVPAAESGRALELGSPPFFITLLMQELRDFELNLTAYTADGRPELQQEVVSSEFGERNLLKCECFDIERDRFPYDDGTFDLVLFCEVLEHLTVNPVYTLSEIHRVLKPGGMLVLSTPNVARPDAVLRLLRGRNIYDPYHLGAPLMGSRHSREYTFGELRELIDGCGFNIERMGDIYINPANRAKRILARTLMTVLSCFTRGRYGPHLFVRARKQDRPFQWHFPPSLFDAGHLSFYSGPRDS